METVFIIFIVITFIYVLYFIIKINSDKSFNYPFEREIDRTESKLISYKSGARVVAINKDGVWMYGNLIGEPEWSLFSLYFFVKFDNGEIIKQYEGNVTLI